MTKLQAFFSGIWHPLFHRCTDDHMLERSEGSLFLRCLKCALRSPGIQIGPLRLSSALPGYPERHRCGKAVLPVMVFDFEVEAMPMPWTKADAPRSLRVH